MELGSFGIFSGHLTLQPADRAQGFVQQIEDLGFGAVWIPESAGKEVLTHAGVLLAACERMIIGTAIANIWARDAMAMANAARTLDDAYPGRFLLGVGIGHKVSVSRRGHTYDRPVERLREYLEAMDTAPFRWPEPVGRVPRLVGALGPKMLAVASSHADGALPYLVPVAHTTDARRILGPDRTLAPQQAVVITPDAETGRRIGREHLANYLLLDNYRRSLLRGGWSARDLDDGGSDALVDALIAWGGPTKVRDHLEQHLSAGADHVAIQILGPNHGYSAWSYASVDRPELRQGERDFPTRQIEQLADVLF
jgi:probable F420-dependent oxidoreductase